MANSLIDYYKPPEELSVKKDDSSNALTVNNLDSSGFSVKNSLSPEANTSSEVTPPKLSLTGESTVGSTETPKNSLLGGPFRAKTLEELSVDGAKKFALKEELLPSSSLPPDQFTSTWGQKIGVGDYKVPLDTFVRAAGMAANALAPNSFGGRLGKGMEQIGHEAQVERNRREYELPNSLLKRRLAIAQIKDAETPTEWKAYLEWSRTQGIPDDVTVKNYRTMTQQDKYHYVQDDDGLVSVFADGKLISGTGKGKDITQNVATSSTNDAGDVTLYNKKGDIVKIVKAAGKTKSVGKGSTAKGRWDLYQAADKSALRKHSISGDVQAMDAEGNWVKATPGQVKGMTKVGMPAKPEKESVLQKLKTERLNKQAKEAIAAGKDPAIVKAKYKEMTGKELY